MGIFTKEKPCTHRAFPKKNGLAYASNKAKIKNYGELGRIKNIP